MTNAGPFDERLVQALLAVSRSMVALAVRNLATLDADVTLAQYRALVLLASGGPQRGVVLARELDVAPSTLTRMCDRLVRKSLIHRFHRDNDRRSIWLGLTPAGRELVGVVMRARLGEIEKVVRTAGLHATESALDLLHDFVEASGELPDDDWWKRWEVSADHVNGLPGIHPQRQT